MEANSFRKALRYMVAILLLLPGIFKLVKGEAFDQYLSDTPLQLPFLDLFFIPVTILEIAGAIILIVYPFKNRRIYQGIYLLFIGTLLTATATVVVPEGFNMFPDQIEMARLYTEANPGLEGLNQDVFPSKIGFINLLMHLMAIAIMALLLLDEQRQLQQNA